MSSNDDGFEYARKVFEWQFRFYDYYKLLTGESTELLQMYPDTSDNSVMQYIFEHVSLEDLGPNPGIEKIEEIVDDWLIEDISAKEARQRILDHFEDFLDQNRC
jgi:hypothetical protein